MTADYNWLKRHQERINCEISGQRLEDPQWSEYQQSVCDVKEMSMWSINIQTWFEMATCRSGLVYSITKCSGQVGVILDGWQIG